MNSIGANPSHWDKHFKLMAEINLSGYAGTGFNIIGDSSARPFSGKFDGNGKNISGFTFNSTGRDFIGIFGCVNGDDAEIKNLRLINPSVGAGQGRSVGSLVGALYGGTVHNCHLKGGSVSGSGTNIGGLVGYNEGGVANCSVDASNVSGNGNGLGGVVGYSKGHLINCSVDSGSVSGDGEHVGGMAGYSSGTVINCHAAATIFGNGRQVGGLIGDNGSRSKTIFGTVLNCFASGEVKGYEEVGGLVGWNGGEISDSYATGAASGNSWVGGLVGKNYYNNIIHGLISKCYSAGPVSGNSSVGGLVGISSGEISYSFALGSISGAGDNPQYLGGLAGWNLGEDAIISNCYATGNIAGGSSNIGGLVGLNDEASVLNCYSTGSVSGNYKIGGLVGENINRGAIERSFWDRQTSELIISAGGRSWTTAQMQTERTFTSRGWDFVGESVNGTDDIWKICCDGGNYPILWWEPPRAYHVDAATGNEDNDGLTRAHAFAAIQSAVNIARGCEQVKVWPGVYTEKVDFLGKAITVTSADDPAVLETPGTYAVWFHHAEEKGSVFKNFIVRNSYGAVYVYVGSPTIRNVTVVGNENGIVAEGGANPDISNCIFWDNCYVDLHACQARYSCIERGGDGEGNITDDPLFADLDNGDYHLLSGRGRYRATTDEWILDDVTSPCVDRGNPTADPSAERMPNGGRINMGAYGGTAYASMSEWPITEDSNRDGVVNMLDLANLVEKWLQKLDWLEQ